ncbi:uncharacterized protein LOC113321205 [Papaver somniferum]|uniref:uncharacterized protein LOC113321205 n=1 Tax=Papaver somniferum TaxID=3469 RepID=UPI000E702734|nr:uncharacterized protein LOC113321205 [Papaver somniferum]
MLDFKAIEITEGHRREMQEFKRDRSILLAQMKDIVSPTIEEGDHVYLKYCFDIFAVKDEIVRTRFHDSTFYNIGDFFPIFVEEFQEIDVPVHKPQSESSDEPYILFLASVDEKKVYFSFWAFKFSQYAGRFRGRIVVFPWCLITCFTNQVTKMKKIIQEISIPIFNI